MPVSDYNNRSSRDKTPMPPKRILKVDLSYLSKCTEFSILKNKNLFQILG